MPARCSVDDVCKQSWPVVIAGAGPAGSLAALLLARQGIPTLLIDKAPFPRPKVCGACLNHRALEVLADVGLGHLLPQMGAIPLHRLHLACRGRAATVQMAKAAALSRKALDQALVDEAIKAGATFLPETTARVLPLVGSNRTLRLHQGTLCRQLSANVVLAADGLSGGLLALVPEWSCSVHSMSWIGAGTTLWTPDSKYEAGTIYMGLGQTGYVGLVKLEDGRLNIAAALGSTALRDAGGTGHLAVAILREAGMEPVDGLCRSRWRGTPALSRRPSAVAFHRVFVLGDAAGYVEPLTGEGIGWALSAARAIVPLAVEGIKCWRPSLVGAWSRTFQKAVISRQTMCRFVTTMARHPAVVLGLEHLLEKTPRLGRMLVRRLHPGIT